MNIAGCNALVTGGAMGLGQAFAEHLLHLGARVWVIDRQDPTAPDMGTFVRCDVGDEQQVARCVEQIEAESGGIDVLINNAAVLRDQALVSRLGKRIRKHSLDDWNETLQSNLTGTFLMSREVAERMIAGKRKGVIVNLSSISRAGNPGQSAYAASKSAVDALTVTWSQELAVYGIRVVAIAPGFVETPMTQNIPPMFLDQIKDKTPQKRFGTREEFAHALQFVIENDYLNGKVLELDGGLRF